MRTAFVLCVVAILIIAVATVATVGGLLLFLADAVDVFLLLVFDVLPHSINILDAKAGSKNSNFHFFVEFRF